MTEQCCVPQNAATFPLHKMTKIRDTSSDQLILLENEKQRPPLFFSLQSKHFVFPRGEFKLDIFSEINAYLKTDYTTKAMYSLTL